MSDELIGKQIGGYEILDRIGRGGMATVYRARQTSMNRIVAMKVLPKHYLQDDTYLQRFEREVKIISQLEHRHIVPVHDYGEMDGQPYIIMRYLPAGSVDDLLKKSTITEDMALRIIQQVAPALDYAHTKGVLHRDLKPSNILLDDDGGAYITDFGIARIVGTEAPGNTITTQGVVGTPSYMSPEQAQGKSLDGRSDVYSLGVMLFEMLTGRRPFENETPYGIAVMQVTTPPPSPRSLNPRISGAIETVILKALKKQPENRYQNAVQLAEALKMAIERPESIHDTQPRGMPIQEMLDGGVLPVHNDSEPTIASDPAQPPVIIPPPVYTPPPSSHSRRVAAPSRLRKPRRGNVWVSVIIGSLIGCALLTIVVTFAIMTVEDLLNPDPEPTSARTEAPEDNAEIQSLIETTTAATMTAEPTAEITPGTPVEIATLDPTSEFARQNLLGPIPGADADGSSTPVFLNATPIPSRTPTEEGTAIAMEPSPTFDPALDAATATILYFAENGGNYHVFLYDLYTGRRQRVTDDSATSSYPRISPDGQRVVYQSNRDGDFDVYVTEVASGSTTKLTDNDVTDRMPSWSPDGEWVIFSSDVREDGNYDLVRVPAGGGTPETVYSSGSRNSHPRYSHDGRFIVFTSGESGDASTWEIVKMELATGDVQVLTRNNTRDAFPTFSPDDGTILYVTDGEGGAAIAILNADGSGLPKVIYDSPGFEWGMDYSPNGKYIIFNSQETTGVSNLYLMRADGSGVRMIDNGGGFYPSWVPS